MALTVEDGTGKADADSYVSLADAAEYAAKMGLTFVVSGDDAALAEGALRRATRWIDARYRARLPGTRLLGREQALEWPRKNAYDTYAEEIPSDEVPREWREATIEAAIREKTTPNSLSPDVVVGKVYQSVSVSGAVSVTYADEGGVVQSQRPTITIIDDLLGSLLVTLAVGQTSVSFLKRA